MPSSRNLSEEPVDNGGSADLEEDRKEQRLPPGPAPGPPASLLPVTVLPYVSSLIAASKFRDGFEFPQLPIVTQLGLECTPHLYITKLSVGSRAWGTNPCSPFTFLMELPIAVHLLLSLDPVATVGPETCFPHGHHCSSWGRAEKLGGEGEGEECGFISACAIQCWL